ncbi:glutamate ligase domain-containing protein [Erythrobacter crassostreae]|uniref:UDP-N-acetylmuramate--alanine ligase n=1 Tax=Erythrobacter crassostreae TaxID=2828328 RepID=A0A9X1F4J4_9SPHN|nr:Mur ligase family protein [Erythrobacter crassostrea]MBV7260115.1 UDP-N-acetylmuramate--alanine ligase [Erythrobacter crassostrea]
MDNGIDRPDLDGRPFFFCGIGGSGMLPLAQIAHGLGHDIAGSDRSRDQGHTPDKFAWLADNGFALHPQDGSGITSADQILIASAAVEDTVPEVKRAKELGCARMSRAELLSAFFNEAGYSVAIGGTSGKSTVTGMISWILSEVDHDPTVMNGAVMKNFADTDNPFASARVGNPRVFVSEVDESDGSIALYRPTIGVLLNVSLDHKSIEELRVLFGDYLASSGCAVINFDNAEARNLASRASQLVSFGIENGDSDITVDTATIDQGALEIRAAVIDNRSGETVPLILPMPGMHNLSNALAAVAAVSAAGIEVGKAVNALQSFKGLARRFDVVGTSENGITVIDDFGHNPEKCAATLRTLKSSPGRVIAFFQPHGYGPLRQMGDELAETFAKELGPDDLTIMCDPVYFGGTVDRSQGSERIIDLIKSQGGNAEHVGSRKDCGTRIAEIAQAGDRIVVMGARDDTLSEFAQSIFEAIE